MWQPNRAQWPIIWAAALLLVLGWPPENGRSLGLKLVNWATDPSGSLPSMPPPLPMALTGDLERIHTLLTELLTRIGYAHRRAASADPIAVRRMVHRLNLNQSDARRWIGILRAVLWKVSE